MHVAVQGTRPAPRVRWPWPLRKSISATFASRIIMLGQARRGPPARSRASDTGWALRAIFVGLDGELIRERTRAGLARRAKGKPISKRRPDKRPSRKKGR